MASINYNLKEYKHLRLKLSAKAPFNVILNIINNIEISGIAKNIEHIRFSILELINNSIRAHNEKGIEDDIYIGIQVFDSSIKFKIRDSGGGFLISSLPYDFYQNYQNIDAKSSEFQRYREKYSYDRFGMGLLSTKKVFSKVEILFYDQNGDICDYNPDTTKGTIIIMEESLKDGQ